MQDGCYFCKSFVQNPIKRKKLLNNYWKIEAKEKYLGSGGGKEKSKHSFLSNLNFKTFLLVYLYGFTKKKLYNVIHLYPQPQIQNLY